MEDFALDSSDAENVVKHSGSAFAELQTYVFVLEKLHLELPIYGSAEDFAIAPSDAENVVKHSGSAFA